MSGVQPLREPGNNRQQSSGDSLAGLVHKSTCAIKWKDGNQRQARDGLHIQEWECWQGRTAGTWFGQWTCLRIGLAFLRTGEEEVFGIDFPALKLWQEIEGEHMADDAGHEELSVLPMEAAVPLVDVQRPLVRCTLQACKRAGQLTDFEANVSQICFALMLHNEPSCSIDTSVVARTPEHQDSAIKHYETVATEV